MTSGDRERGWGAPAAVTAVLASLLLLLSPAARALTGPAAGGEPAARAVHHVEAVTPAPAPATAPGRTGCCAPGLGLVAVREPHTPCARTDPTDCQPHLGAGADGHVTPARAPPLKA